MPQVKQAAPRRRLLLLLLLLLNCLRGARAYGKFFFLDGTETVIQNVIFALQKSRKNGLGTNAARPTNVGSKDQFATTYLENVSASLNFPLRIIWTNVELVSLVFFFHFLLNFQGHVAYNTVNLKKNIFCNL